MDVSSVGDGVQLGDRQRKPGVASQRVRTQRGEGSVDNHNTGLNCHHGTALYGSVMAVHNTEWTTIESGRAESN